MGDAEEFLKKVSRTGRYDCHLVHVTHVAHETSVGVDVQPRLAPFVPQHCTEVSRTLYAVLLETFPSKEPIWRAAAQLEMQHGTPQQVQI